MNKDISKLQEDFRRHNQQIVDYVSRSLPVKAGAKVKSSIQANFRDGGFHNNGLERWPETRRQRIGFGTDSHRGPLMSSRKVLYNSIRYDAGRGKVNVYSNVAHARIHNEGGETHPRITSKMRKFAWAKYYEAEKKGNDGDFWRGLALTKKQTLNIKIPKRKFMGRSEQLEHEIKTMIKNDFETILKQ